MRQCGQIVFLDIHRTGRIVQITVPTLFNCLPDRRRLYRFARDVFHFKQVAAALATWTPIVHAVTMTLDAFATQLFGHKCGSARIVFLAGTS